MAVNKERKGYKYLHSPEVEAEICERYVAGTKYRDLVAQYGGSTSSIVGALRRGGISPRVGGPPYRNFTDEEVSEMARMWSEEGASQTRIAKRFDTAQATVSRVLINQGIQPLTPRFLSRRGSDHSSWKGGRVRHQGYWMVLVLPDSEWAPMRNRTGYVMEHRLVVAKAAGRCLHPAETVHHVNGDPADNRLENLQLRSGKHGKGVAFQCLDCGSHNVQAVPLK